MAPNHNFFLPVKPNESGAEPFDSIIRKLRNSNRSVPERNRRVPKIGPFPPSPVLDRILASVGGDFGLLRKVVHFRKSGFHFRKSGLPIAHTK